MVKPGLYCGSETSPCKLLVKDSDTKNITQIIHVSQFITHYKTVANWYEES